MANKTEMSLEDFDFGFSVVDEKELEAVTTASAKVEAASGTAQAVQDKMDKMYNAVMPLLNNLQKNPEKEYIYWPNRLDKVEEFSDKLKEVYTA